MMGPSLTLGSVPNGGLVWHKLQGEFMLVAIQATLPSPPPAGQIGVFDPTNGAYSSHGSGDDVIYFQNAKFSTE